MSSESNSKWSKSPKDTGDQNLILVDSWICLFLIQEINFFFLSENRKQVDEREIRKQVDEKVFLYIIACCYQHYGI